MAFDCCPWSEQDIWGDLSLLHLLLLLCLLFLETRPLLDFELYLALVLGSVFLCNYAMLDIFFPIPISYIVLCLSKRSLLPN